MMASLRPVEAMVCCRRWRYGLVSVNCSGSSEIRFGKCSVYRPSSNSARSRSRGADAEMMCALRADVQAFFEIFLVDELSAAGALDPQAFGNPAWFFGGGGCNRLAGLLEPRHQGY